MAVQKPLHFHDSLVGGHAQIYREDFNGASGVFAGALWDQNVVGGGAIALSGNSSINLSVGTGATDQADITFKQPVQFPFRSHTIFQLSASTLTNQQIDIWLESVSPDDFQPDGKNTFGIRLDSTTPNGSWRTCRMGEGDTEQVTASAGTGNNWASGIVGVEFEMDPDGCTFWPVSGEGTRNQGSTFYNNRMPNPSSWYVLRARIRNSGAAAANTLQIHWALIQENVEVSAEISGGRSYQYSGGYPGVVPVCVQGVTNTTIAPASGSSGLKHRLLSAATTNATSVKTTAARLYNIKAYNESASKRYLKLYNKASAPTVGTDTPVATHVLQPGSNLIDWATVGSYFSTGLAYAITGALADADTTAIGANEVALNMDYM